MSGRGSSLCVAGVPESPVWGFGGSVCAAPALAFAVAVRMRAAERGGSEDEVEEVDEAEDEEEVVDAGWAVMRAGLWAAASAAATAGRLEGMSSGKGKGKLLGRSPNSSVSVIPTCPSQHPFRLPGSPTP